MALVAKFTFNPFQENTYVLYDDSGACLIIDPGCYTAAEQQTLSRFIDSNNLRPERLVNTHCHIDHVFGNRYVADRYDLALEIHEGELPVLQAVPKIAQLYGIPLPDDSPEPGSFIKDGDTIRFGNSQLLTLYTPGHSPASISLYDEAAGFVVAGDVLFQSSIGRTDLPGGHFATLIDSIRSQLFTLPDKTTVYPGHGPDTTIGYEKKHNPFLNSSAIN